VDEFGTTICFVPQFENTAHNLFAQLIRVMLWSGAFGMDHLAVVVYVFRYFLAPFHHGTMSVTEVPGYLSGAVASSNHFDGLDPYFWQLRVL
jgi:hypothetical protein